MEERGICFVIMGFGTKTDLNTGRELDLDSTYLNIIKPAAEESGLKCIRADEIRHSGTIDVPMYKHLIQAEVVIADLSTSNSNAFYELGVRHALKPRTTIAISENKLKPPFDVNHTVIHQYEHLGSDIGFREVHRFKKALKETIAEVLVKKDIDSPVYTYIQGLIPPEIPAEQDLSINDEQTNEQTLGFLLKKAASALSSDDFISARSLYTAALAIDQNNAFIIQKLAVATYKSKVPDHVSSLLHALSILEPLNVESSTDPETLGIAGAIYKRLWEETNKEDNLDSSILYYEKGFFIKNDYYNGINVAFLYNIRSSLLTDPEEKIADFIMAKRVRKRVIKICNLLFEDENLHNRSDKYWIVATLQEAHIGLGNYTEAEKYERIAATLTDNNWMIDSTKTQIKKLEQFLNKKPN